ncbi:MAG: prepilin-type N-terminal cleavage/methylation domain-containing protein [Candidatus Eisenbacteria bacterium]|nr:prepilin-type N-terminal cleavage/methylation domain-containing protein [Candidatus Eisenbacteria bacterium]
MEKGFTLVEVVIVIIIGGIALIPLLTLFASTATESSQAEVVSTASFLAKEKMDTIIADKMSPERGFSYITSGNYPQENPVNGFNDYVRTVTISPDSVYDSVTFRTVKVRVQRGTSADVVVTTWVVDH